MRAVLGLTAWQLRHSWRGWLAIAVLVALAGGAVLTATAGALRTDTAYARFRAASGPSDVIVSPAGNGLDGYYPALARLPGVAASAPIAGMYVRPDGPAGAAGLHVVMSVPLDDEFQRQVDRPRVIAGRLPDPGRPQEVAVDQIAARILALRVGGPLGVTVATGAVGKIRPRHLTLRVVGVLVTLGTVVPVTSLYRGGGIYASPALYRELGPGYMQYDTSYVRLRPGASVIDFGVRAQAIAARFPATGGQVYVSQESIQVAAIERSIRPQAVTLALFALALALTALLIIGQAIRRQLLEEARDAPTLAALGLTRDQLMAGSLLRVLAATVTGAAGAVAVAVAASPLTPIGPARLAETQPGVSVNVPVLAAGLAAIPALFLVRIARTAWRQSGLHPAAGPDTRLARSRPGLTDLLAAAGVPLSAVTGLRFARDNRTGRAAVPMGGAVLSLAVAVAAVAGAVTFGANLVRLADTPRLYGQDWNVALDLEYETFTPAKFAALTARVPGVSSVTYGVHLFVGIGNSVVPAIGITRGRGPVTSPTITAGRAPRSPDEIAVGASVLRRLGGSLGQRVPVQVGTVTRMLRVVGTATFPYFGEGELTPTDVGEGVETTVSLLAPLLGGTSTGAGYNFALVRFAAGSPVGAEVAAFERALAPFCASALTATCVVTNQRPNTVSNYAAIDATPAVLAGVLAVLGLGVLAQFTVGSARRRRRDFAILKVLGTSRAQLAAVAFWQTTAVTAAALVVGIPLGVSGGHGAWLLFSGQAGLPAAAMVPLAVLWMVPATMAAALLIAWPPARSVAHVATAATLRSE